MDRGLLTLWERRPARGRVPAALLAAALLLGACQSAAPTSGTVLTFATATDRTAAAVEEAFAATNRLHAQAETAERAAAYAIGDEPDLRAVEPLLSEALLRPRRQALATLKAYAASLARLADGHASAGVGAEFTSLGTAVAGLTGEVYGALPGGPVDGRYRDLISTGASAIGAIAERIVENRIRGTVAQVTVEMQPRVEAFAALTSVDLERLSLLIENQESKIRTALQTVLAFDEGGDAAARYGLYLARVEQLAEVRTLRRGVDEAQATLARLVSAHRALAQPERPDARRQALLLLQEAQELVALFRDLRGDR